MREKSIPFHKKLRSGDLTQLSVVDGVEEYHSSNSDLEEGGNTRPLRLHVLVLPAPESCEQSTMSLELRTCYKAQFRKQQFLIDMQVLYLGQ
jgi:hypothetical protein